MVHQDFLFTNIQIILYLTILLFFSNHLNLVFFSKLSNPPFRLMNDLEIPFPILQEFYKSEQFKKITLPIKQEGHSLCLLDYLLSISKA